MLERMLDRPSFSRTTASAACRSTTSEHPFVFGHSEVRYDPAESENKIKGGNSNWRGPIWFPTTFLIIDSLRKLGAGYGDALKVSPEESGDEQAGT